MAGEVTPDPAYLSGVNAVIKVDFGGASPVALPTKTYNIKDESGSFDSTNPETGGWGHDTSTIRRLSGAFEAFVPKGVPPITLTPGQNYEFATDRGDGYGWSFVAMVSDIDHKYDGKGEQSIAGNFKSQGPVTLLTPGP